MHVWPLNNSTYNHEGSSLATILARLDDATVIPVCENGLAKAWFMKSNLVIYYNSCHVNINNLLYSDRYFSTDWQFEMFKRGKANGHDTLFSVYFKICLLNFTNICCWCALELPH